MKLDMTPLLNKRRSALDFDFTLNPDTVENACGLPEGIRLTEPVRVTGKVTDLNGYMSLNAAVSTRYEAECDRCLAPVGAPISFELARTVALNPADAEGEDDYDIIWIKEGKIDFDCDVIEELSLELPIYHLCSDDCPGLCPVCGKRLDGSCKCKAEKEIDPRLEIFKKLLDKTDG